MGTVAALVVAATIACPALGQPTETVIVPGRSFGPVMLGMPAREASAAATRFERKTGCNIDLLVARGVVAAAGSRWGGCLHLQLPADKPLLLVSEGPFFVPIVPAVVGIGGPPAVLVNAFGAPRVVRHSPDSAALIFTNGLAAQVVTVHANGGCVGYLAVQAAGLRSVPRIGYFRNEASAHTKSLYSDGGSGDGFGLPPTSH